MNASFEEKSGWITLGALVVVFGAYFVIALQMLLAGVDIPIAYVPLLVGVIVALIVILSIGHAVAALIERPEPLDERDRLIAWRSEHDASWLLGAGVIAAVIALLFPVSRVWIANGLLCALVLSEVLKYALLLYRYRRG